MGKASLLKIGLSTGLSLCVTMGTVGVISAYAEGRQIEEVVVTAQRVSESVQDVPIAVTALTSDMLVDRQVINPSDLQLNAPNDSFTATNFGNSSFSIRGIGRPVISGTGKPPALPRLASTA